MLALEVQWLNQLLDQGDWAKSLKVAEQLLLRGEYTTKEFAVINYALCKSRAHRQELIESIPPGELAKRLCLDTKQWDLLAKVILLLGVSYGRTRSYGPALSTLYEYFKYQSNYSASHNLISHIWHNIGNVQRKCGRTDEATDAFRRARLAYKDQGDSQGYNTVTQHLLECYLESSLSEVPTLLSELRRYATSHLSEPDSQARYFLSRALYAYQMKAYHWAASLCVAGLAEPNKATYTEFNLNLTLSKCLSAMGNYKDALGYALAARLTAIRTRFFELEFIAIEAMYDLMSSQGSNLLIALDNEYLQQGLDMMPFVGSSVLHERGQT